MARDQTEPPGNGGSPDFQEYRVHRSGERVIDTRVGDVAAVDERLGDLVGGRA